MLLDGRAVRPRVSPLVTRRECRVARVYQEVSRQAPLWKCAMRLELILEAVRELRVAIEALAAKKES